PLDKYVLIFAPHTSNWDAFWLIALRWYFRTPANWIGKHSIFFPPLGWLLRALGGIPVNRSDPGDLLPRLAAEYRSRARLMIGMAPEGTRHRTEQWKSGFHRLARRAQVSIVLGYLDYARRRGGYGPVIRPTDDVRADMDEIRAFYADKI